MILKWSNNTVSGLFSGRDQILDTPPQIFFYRIYFLLFYRPRPIKKKCKYATAKGIMVHYKCFLEIEHV